MFYHCATQPAECLCIFGFDFAVYIPNFFLHLSLFSELNLGIGPEMPFSVKIYI